MPSSQSRHCKVSTPFGGESRKLKSFRLSKSLESVLFRSARWERAISRERSTRIPLLTAPTSATRYRVLRQRRARRTAHWWICWRQSLSARRRHLLRSHSPGFLLGSRGWCPFQGRRNYIGCRRTSRQHPSSSAKEISAKLRAPHPRSRCKELGTARPRSE